MKPPKLHHIEARNESGELVMFEMPRAGMYYGTASDLNNSVGTVSPKTMDKLLDLHYKILDLSDVLIHDLDDKIRVVNKLKRVKESWV